MSFFIASLLFVQQTKTGTRYTLVGISATRLSRRDPEGFPSHFRKWFSIIVYR